MYKRNYCKVKLRFEDRMKISTHSFNKQVELRRPIVLPDYFSECIQGSWIVIVSLLDL